MKREGTILVVDDNRAILTTLDILLGSCFRKVVVKNAPGEIPTTLRENPDIDVVLLDMNFSGSNSSGGEGLYWLSQIKQINPSIAVVLFTAYADIDLAVRAIKDGATDFIQKPWDNAKLILTLQNAISLRQSQRQVRNIKAAEIERTPMFWGSSEVMTQLREHVAKVATSDANILITGENGTGKEMLSREVHRLSNRANQLLVNVDMGAITESLFESELFGHVKGSFTDAKNDRIGKFEAADGGTLFLDEIGNLPYHLQAKLLAALQNRAIIRVGSNTPLSIDIRLITATNRDLAQMVCEQKFREDLYYRLNTIILHIPPLRERPEDIMPLANLFLSQYATKYRKPTLSFSDKAANKLEKAHWAGNIRELQHSIEKAVILADGDSLNPEDFLLARAQQGSRLVTLEDMERDMIKRQMETCGDNLSKVAETLGITRQTLYNKMKKYEI